MPYEGLLDVVFGSRKGDPHEAAVGGRVERLKSRGCVLLYNVLALRCASKKEKLVISFPSPPLLSSIFLPRFHFPPCTFANLPLFCYIFSTSVSRCFFFEYSVLLFIFSLSPSPPLSLCFASSSIYFFSRSSTCFSSLPPFFFPYLRLCFSVPLPRALLDVRFPSTCSCFCLALRASFSLFLSTHARVSLARVSHLHVVPPILRLRSPVARFFAAVPSPRFSFILSFLPSSRCCFLPSTDLSTSHPPFLLRPTATSWIRMRLISAEPVSPERSSSLFQIIFFFSDRTCQMFGWGQSERLKS